MKIVFQRFLLVLLTGILCLIAAFLSFQVYISIRNYTNNMKAIHVTPLKKEYLIFPKGTKYSMYFEPKPNSIEVNDYNWSSGSATYTINSDALNERFEYSIEKPENTFRIITLGDSFTFGHFVNTSDNWSELLEKLLNADSTCSAGMKYEVINLGVRGYDLNFAAERFKQRGKKYNPDMVLWLVNDHHFYTVREIVTRRERQIMSKMSEEEEKKYWDKGDFFPAVHMSVDETLRKYPLKRLEEQENAALYDLADEFVGPLIIIANRISPKYMALLNIFKNYRKNPTTIYTDISDITKIPDAAFPDGHPSNIGHELYAKDILEKLRNSKVICTLPK